MPMRAHIIWTKPDPYDDLKGSGEPTQKPAMRGFGAATADKWMEVSVAHQFKMVAEREFNAKSAQFTGSPIHHPVEILKEFDNASPILFKALHDGKEIKQIDVVWYTPDGEEYFRHTFHRVILTSIEQWMPNTRDRDKGDYVHMEWVRFSYARVDIKKKAVGFLSRGKNEITWPGENGA